MSRLEHLKYIQFELSQLTHSDQCRIEYIGDGLPCNCGYWDATKGVESMIKAETPALEQADGYA